MRSLRQRLTILKNKINEVLPDDDDLYGYLGINKVRILDSLTESYDLLSALALSPDKFETVFAKREVAISIDKAQEFFSSHFNSDNLIVEFNNFLNSITNIKYILKDTYISISDNPLRVDYQLAKASEDLENLTSYLSSISEIQTQIETIKENSNKFMTDLKEFYDSSSVKEEELNAFVLQMNNLEKSLVGTGEKITSWKAEIQAIKDDITIKQTEITKTKTEVDLISETSIENNEEIEKQIEILTNQLITNTKHQDHIQKTIEDVSRYGMAGSFKIRKDELMVTQLIWAILTILSLGGLLVISYFIMKPLIEDNSADLNQMLYKIPLFASAVWLGWFCAKQYGFNTRIREDYAYKYAISMAFEGYKNETKEINPDLLEKLIELTILNAARSPERIFNTRSNPGSPYNEMIDSVAGHLFGSKKGSPEE